MKFIHNMFTLLGAIVGVIGGLFWGYNNNWDYEPIILLIVSFTEIIAYLTMPKRDAVESVPVLLASSINSSNNINNNLDIKIVNSNENDQEGDRNNSDYDNRDFQIESKKNKIGILFIDDDKNFNIVRILKDSGWKNTKTIVDVKSIDNQYIKNSEIIFVDINGVGKLLNLHDEGLDLALMIKQKYVNKKVIIYSANKTSNSFHQAWAVVDNRLEKNALPYQFQNLVENYSLEYYN